MDKPEAKYYEQLEDNKVQCHLCHWECKLDEGKEGVCSGKKNVDGKLLAINYGEVVSMGMDPIEKKPLYHFHPGMSILSIAPNGCNLRCQFCQNWQISIGKANTQYYSPEQIIQVAKDNDSDGIAYTYSEPLIWYEYLLDCCKLAHENGLYNVLVTNGHILEDPLRELLPHVDAMNMDLKAMNQEFYKEICSGDLETALNTAKIANKHLHLEITNLLVTNHNDTREQITKLVDWVKDNLGEDTPLHFSKYFPNYKFSEPSTPDTIMEMAFEIGKEKLWDVFVGNTFISGATDSICHNCGNTLIRRSGFGAKIVGLNEDATCDKCGAESGIVL